MKAKKIYLSGSRFSIAQKCPASLTFDFSTKLMAEGGAAQEGTDAHAVIADDIESMRHFLPPKTKTLTEHIEKRFNVTYKGITLSGGVDYYGHDRDTLHVTDWKTGPAGIDHLGPAQIEFYAFLILLSMTKAERSGIKSVVLSLVSPRLNQKKTFTRSPDEILALTEKFDAVLAALKKKEKPRPGEHCRYCPARFVCPVLKEEMKRFSDPRFQGNLLKVTAEDLRTLAIAAAVIMDIRKYVAELIENGKTIAGVQLVTQNAARIFPDGIDAEMIAEALGVSPASLYEQKLRTPAQLEKAGFDLSKAAEYISTTTRKVLKVEQETGGTTKQKTGNVKPKKIKVKGK